MSTLLLLTRPTRQEVIGDAPDPDDGLYLLQEDGDYIELEAGDGYLLQET